MLEYRELKQEEADKISQIDATWFIKNAWRWNAAEEKYELVEINWTEHELPNGYEWHLRRFRETIQNGGKAFGCFDGQQLVGYATLNAEIFGVRERYVLLDQLFVSHAYRKQGIGKRLVDMCREQADAFFAWKIYVCAASAEDTIAFYRGLGFSDAWERDEVLFQEDPNDIQLELRVRRIPYEDRFEWLL